MERRPHITHAVEEKSGLSCSREASKGTLGEPCRKAQAKGGYAAAPRRFGGGWRRGARSWSHAGQTPRPSAGPLGAPRCRALPTPAPPPLRALRLLPGSSALPPRPLGPPLGVPGPAPRSAPSLSAAPSGASGEAGLRAPPFLPPSLLLLPSPVLRDPAWGGGEAAQAWPPRQPVCSRGPEARFLGLRARRGRWRVGAVRGELRGPPLRGAEGAEVSGLARALDAVAGAELGGQMRSAPSTASLLPWIPRRLRRPPELLGSWIAWYLEAESGKRVSSTDPAPYFPELPESPEVGWAQEKGGQERHCPR